jgi:hypothetical protein
VRKVTVTRLWFAEVLPPFLQAAVRCHLRFVEIPKSGSQSRPHFLIHAKYL